MKTSGKTLLVILSLSIATVGCRRSDLREVTINIPGLAEAATNDAAYAAGKAKIAWALGTYEGVKKDSLKWDDAGRSKLTLRFDSLLVAEMNLVKAIDEAGFKVEYPVLKPGEPAGYINARKPEIE